MTKELPPELVERIEEARKSPGSAGKRPRRGDGEFRNTVAERIRQHGMDWPRSIGDQFGGSWCVCGAALGDAGLIDHIAAELVSHEVVVDPERLKRVTDWVQVTVDGMAEEIGRLNAEVDYMKKQLDGREV